MLSREIEEVESTVDVCLGVKLWLRQRRPHTRARRQMDHAIELSRGEDSGKCRSISDVCFVKVIGFVTQMFLDVSLFDRGIVEVVEVVDHGYLPVSFGKQTIDKMRSYETCATGYENVFH